MPAGRSARHLNWILRRSEDKLFTSLFSYRGDGMLFWTHLDLNRFTYAVWDILFHRSHTSVYSTVNSQPITAAYFIRKWSHIATHLVVLVLVDDCCCCCCAAVFKKLIRAPLIVSNQIGMKFGRIVLQVVLNRLRIDWGVGLLMWRHNFKMAAVTSPQKSECIQTTKRMPGASAAASRRHPVLDIHACSPTCC